MQPVSGGSSFRIYLALRKPQDYARGNQGMDSNNEGEHNSAIVHCAGKYYESGTKASGMAERNY